MPSLTLYPPGRQSSTQSSPPPQLPPLAPASPATNGQYPAQGSFSPVAPEYSPITPRAQPAFPARYPPPTESAPDATISAERNEQPIQPQDSIALAAQYIPKPQPQPFSSEDATDAIALRAAISSLQFQKKKAQDDIRALEKIRKQALDEPLMFKSELAAGKLKEQKPTIGDLRAILNQTDSDDEDDETGQGASEGDAQGTGHQDLQQVRREEVPDSQASRPTTSGSAKAPSPKPDDPTPFGPIPGPQSVVRMPYVNWNKYHITGEPLDSMHEQQRKWPGSFAYGQDRGREQVVAAPYSPWQDSVDGQQRWEVERRNDSIVTPTTTVTPTVSEHPMETRRNKNIQ